MQDLFGETESPGVRQNCGGIAYDEGEASGPGNTPSLTVGACNVWGWNWVVSLDTVERRGGVLGIILGDGEWLSVAEAKVSHKCRNVIAWDKEHGPVLWRSKTTIVDIMALMSIKEGK